MTLLEKEDMDDSQIRMLEHALANDGKVSAADYLTAWDNYRQCMVGKGYTAPTMHNINGIYIHQTKMDASNLSEAKQEKSAGTITTASQHTCLQWTMSTE